MCALDPHVSHVTLDAHVTLLTHHVAHVPYVVHAITLDPHVAHVTLDSDVALVPLDTMSP